MTQSSTDTLLNVMEAMLEAMRASGSARIGFNNASELRACVLPGPAEPAEPAEQGDLLDPEAIDTARPAEPVPVAEPALVLVGLQLSDLGALSSALAMSGLDLRQVRAPAVPTRPGDYVHTPTFLPEVFVDAVVPLDALLSLSAAPGVLSIEPTGFGVTHG